MLSEILVNLSPTEDIKLNTITKFQSSMIDTASNTLIRNIGRTPSTQKLSKQLTTYTQKLAIDTDYFSPLRRKCISGARVIASDHCDRSPTRKR